MIGLKEKENKNFFWFKSFFKSQSGKY